MSSLRLSTGHEIPLDGDRGGSCVEVGYGGYLAMDE